MDNQHRMITGYRELNGTELTLINELKALGSTIEEEVTQLRNLGEHVDQRWVSIGQTHMQQGLMALIRAVAQPTSF